MKKLVLLLTGLLIGLAPVAAKTSPLNQGEDFNITNYNHQPIRFIERGVEFLVFNDGTFDFNTQLNTTYGDTYYRRSRVRSTNRTFGAPGTRTRYNRPRGVIITQDRDGKVRRIGNVFINYNRQNQLKRVGSVYLGYNRRGLLTRVGGLRIYYRGYRITHITGQVNRFNTNCNICGATSCTTNHFESDYDDDDDDHYDDNYYYYKKGKTLKRNKNKRRK